MDDLSDTHLVGEMVLTSFGEGEVKGYREEDEMYEVKLRVGTLFTQDVQSKGRANDDRRRNEDEDETDAGLLPKHRPPSAMELNVAYEAMEKMRKLNLELECVEAGIVFSDEAPLDFHQCTKCLLTKGPAVLSASKKISRSSQILPDASLRRTLISSKAPALVTSSGKPLFPRLYKLRMESERLIETSKKKIDKTLETSKKVLLDENAINAKLKEMKQERMKRQATPCLICASPTCSAHMSPTFRRENITVCEDCVTMFEIDLENNFDEKQADHMVDLYDRAVLLLKYSSQFIEDIASSLEQSTERHNKTSLGSSSVGLVSGALGVAAACTILTPAGPPLLIASLLFGGSATAVQTGSEAMKYFSEPNKLADRILALHGMVQSILSTTSYIRETTLVPYINNALPGQRPMAKQLEKTKSKAVTVGIRMGSNAATGMARISTALVEEGATAGRFVSRASTNLARTARFARFAGGALSAATILLEARELNQTVSAIRQGNPCEKAISLRKVQDELKKLPSTSVVEGMVTCYVKVMANHARKKKQEEEQEVVVSHTENELELMEEVVSSLEAQHEANSNGATINPMPMNSSVTRRKEERRDLSKSSLLRRIQAYKENQARAEMDLIT